MDRTSIHDQSDLTTLSVSSCNIMGGHSSWENSPQSQRNILANTYTPTEEHMVSTFCLIFFPLNSSWITLLSAFGSQDLGPLILGTPIYHSSGESVNAPFSESLLVCLPPFFHIMLCSLSHPHSSICISGFHITYPDMHVCTSDIHDDCLTNTFLPWRITTFQAK